MYISPQLACQIGLNESIVLMELHRLLQEARADWVALTYEEWQRRLPFWSPSTIRRVIRKLERLGFIESANLNKNKIDQTKSYRIQYEELQKQNIVLNNQYENVMPIDEQSGQCDRPNAQEVPASANGALEAGEPHMPHADGPSNAHRPAFKQPPFVNEINIVPNEQSTKEPSCLQGDITTHNQKLNDEDKMIEKKTVFAFYERHRFYPHNDYVTQRIEQWIENTNEPLVLEAMKTALEYGSTSWKYVETVLLDWQAKRYKTVEDVENAKKRKRRRPAPKVRAPVRRELLPDWFDEYQKQWEADMQVEQDQPIDVEALRERLKQYG